ncbi:MAG: DUF1175 family protein, partial [Bdellovibrionota bacterium]
MRAIRSLIMTFTTGWCFLVLAGQYTISSADLISTIRNKLLYSALVQSEKISGHWDESQRDCAGLVRFAYREAVSSTNLMWVDQQGKVTDYLSAQELLSFNFDYFGHDVNSRQIQTGDLLAFHLPHEQREDTWHLMLAFRSPPGSPDKILLIYHNGEKGKHAQIKKTWAEELLQKSQGPWRAVKNNQNFLGVFRWKGWAALAQN